MRDSRADAVRLRRLHEQPEILVLVNVWDAASARTVARLPGCRAIATASWSIAAALGVPDGEVLNADALLDQVARVVGAVELPVTADLEAGYGDVAGTVARAIDVGVSGCNLEDGLRPLEEAAGRVAAARRRADAEGVPLVINARTDVRFDREQDEEDAVRRANAYLDAGADCVFPINARSPDLLRRLVAAIDGPVSAFGVPDGPSPRELQHLGVVRVSLGPGPLGAALAALGRPAACCSTATPPLTTSRSALDRDTVDCFNELDDAVKHRSERC